VARIGPLVRSGVTALSQSGPRSSFSVNCRELTVNVSIPKKSDPISRIRALALARLQPGRNFFRTRARTEAAV
jgi:hypothetical protein